LAISNTVRNLAAAPATAGASRIDFYLSTDNVLDGGDRLLGSRNVSALAPLTSAAATTVVTVPADVAQGSYYIIAVADAGNQVAESNETNNTMVSAVPIQIRQPDLTITALSAPTGAAGHPLAIANTVRNVASAPAAAGASRIDFYLSTDNVLDGGDRLLGSRNVAGLAALTSLPATTVLTIPADVTQGNYYVIAVADAGNQVAESDETNNTIVSATPILIVPDVRGTYSLSASSLTLIGCANPANEGSFAATGTTTVSTQSAAHFSGSAVLLFTNFSTGISFRVGIGFSAQILSSASDFSGANNFSATVPPRATVVASGNGTLTGTFDESPSQDTIHVNLAAVTRSGERCRVSATLLGTK
jgi:hypothetical protein